MRYLAILTSCLVAAATASAGNCYRLPNGQVQCTYANSTPPVYGARPYIPPPAPPVYYQPPPRIYYPVQGGTVTQSYGVPWSQNPSQQVHTGVDIAVRQGTPVYSTATGTVVHNGNLGTSSQGVSWGGYTVIQNQGGPAPYNGYLHVNPTVSPGQRVYPGQQIGTVYDNHLHFNQCAQEAGCQAGAFPNYTYTAPTYSSSTYTQYYQPPYQYQPPAVYMPSQYGPVQVFVPR